MENSSANVLHVPVQSYFGKFFRASLPLSDTWWSIGGCATGGIRTPPGRSGGMAASGNPAVPPAQLDPPDCSCLNLNFTVTNF